MVVMMFIPALLLAFLEADDSMYYNFILLITAFPIVSIGVGIFAGINFKKNWKLLLIAPIVFLLATVLLFTPWQNAYIAYFVIYGVLGVLGAGIVPLYRYLQTKI
jgi:hypothetical protein